MIKLVTNLSSMLIWIFYTVLLVGFLYSPLFFSTQSGDLTLYTFADTLSLEVCELFEQQTGIHVHVKYYDSSGELLTELGVRQGKGYDIIAAPDYVIQTIIKNGWVQKLDHNQFPYARMIDARLLHHCFDQENVYSLPFAWSVYGIAYDKRYFPALRDDPDWTVVFEPKKYHTVFSDSHIALVNEPAEALFLASIYLTGGVKAITDTIPRITELFCDQKKYIQAYINGNYTYYLLGKIAPLIVVESSAVRRAVTEHEQFDFVIPKQGSLLSIENVVISSSCKNVENAHKFLNFLLSPSASLLNFRTTGYNPSNKSVYQKLMLSEQDRKNFLPSDEVFKRLHLMHNNFLLSDIEYTWLKVRTHY